MKQKRKVVAYRGEYRHGESTVIVFSSDRNGVAKNSARIYLSDVDWDHDYIDVRVRRAPEYDQFAERRFVPVSFLVEQGWFLTCADCRKNPLYSDEVGLVEDAKPTHGEWYGGKAYCKTCADKRTTHDNPARRGGAVYGE